jgi:hypothetical protein
MSPAACYPSISLPHNALWMGSYVPALHGWRSLPTLVLARPLHTAICVSGIEQLLCRAIIVPAITTEHGDNDLCGMLSVPLYGWILSLSFMKIASTRIIRRNAIFWSVSMDARRHVATSRELDNRRSVHVPDSRSPVYPHWDHRVRIDVLARKQA